MNPSVKRQAEHLHDLGARALYEFVVEIAAIHGDDVLDRLGDYTRLDAEMLRATGGDRFPASPMRVVA
jgi:hypothetical protein